MLPSLPEWYHRSIIGYHSPRPLVASAAPVLDHSSSWTAPGLAKATLSPMQVPWTTNSSIGLTNTLTSFFFFCFVWKITLSLDASWYYQVNPCGCVHVPRCGRKRDVPAGVQECKNARQFASSRSSSFHLKIPGCRHTLDVMMFHILPDRPITLGASFSFPYSNIDYRQPIAVLTDQSNIPHR